MQFYLYVPSQMLYILYCISPSSVREELESRDGRIRYELLQGVGPHTGWVTPLLRGKELLSKKGATEAFFLLKREAAAAVWAGGAAILGLHTVGLQGGDGDGF